MSNEAKPAPKSWSLEAMLEAVKAKAPKMEAATIRELRDHAHKKECPKCPDVDSLQSALGRIVEAIQGKPLGKQKVAVGKFRTGETRYGYKQYYANVDVRDVLAVGLFLESKSSHDERTKVLYDGAYKAKWGNGNDPWHIQQLVDELFHMLQVAARAGA